MAASTSAAASTSSAADSNNNTSYDVFVSHRGPDVKKTFASHLYRRLISHGLRVFLDYKELQVGEGFPSQIKNAISAASLHVAIFSPTYADSQWCLDELVLMLKSGAHIIPVFHHVKPTELRRTDRKGVYATSLWNLEKKKNSDSRPRYNSKTIKKWRKALSQVADISGLDLEAFNGDEGELLDKVVEAVLRKLVKTPLNVARYPTGLADKVQDFETKVLYRSQPISVSIFHTTMAASTSAAASTSTAADSNNSTCYDVLRKYVKTPLNVARYPTGLAEKVQDFETKVLFQQRRGVFGITGLGGVGKTTLAMELFNRKSSEYSKSCFLLNVRENAKKSLDSLQSQLLKGLFQLELDIDNRHAGIEKLKKRLSSCKVLLVLDDVDQPDQVFALLPQLNDLHHDSLFLITSRDKNVLVKSGVQKSSIYQLSGLDRQRSSELFRSHAFRGSHPISLDFEDLVRDFVTACDGWPLSLIFFGDLLHEQQSNKSSWKNELEEFRNRLPDEIQKCLQITYDALKRDEQQIFLDIACFFVGEDRGNAISVWDGSGWNGPRGFQSLLDKGLVELNPYDQIIMHNHLRHMGRDLAKSSGLPCRLWCGTKHIEDLLQQSSSQAPIVRGIKMVSGDHLTVRPPPGNFLDKWSPAGNFLDKWSPAGNFLDKWSPAGNFLDKLSPTGNFLYKWFGPQPRTWIKNLQLLNIAGMSDDHLKYILEGVDSPDLLWFRWNNCPCSSLPPYIPMEKLRVLEVEGDELETLWQEDLQAPLQLRSLWITSRRFSKIPNSIGQLKHLERMVVNSWLDSDIPKEFCYLTSLKHLVLRIHNPKFSFFGTTLGALKRLPDSFGNLSELEHIELSQCLALESLPNSFGNLSSLKYIKLHQCRALVSLPDSVCNLSKLEHVDLSECSALERLPDAFGNLSRLERIDLSNCIRLERLPDSFGNLSRLEHIGLYGCRALESLPDSFGNLSSLKYIDLNSCPATIPDSVGDLINLQFL